MRHLILLALLCGSASTLLVACSGSPAAEAVTPSVTPSADPQPPAAAVGRYAVHEWGLVDVGRDGSVELAAGPGQANLPRPALPGPGGGHPSPPASVRKPVLYFHLLEGEVQVRVGANMTYGSMLERFPRASMEGTQVVWEQVQLVQRTCARTPYPAAGSAGCQGLSDGYCEAAELALYEARDATCLVVGGQDYNHLFYRGGGRGLSLPVHVTAPPGSATIRNDSAHAIPYALLITSASAGTTSSRRAVAPVNIRRFGRIPAGTQAEVRESIPVDEAIDAVRAELGLLGLTSGETQAFMNAWEQAVFRAPNVGNAVLYLLPPELVDAVSTLTLTPAPEETRRAMVVRVEL